MGIEARDVSLRYGDVTALDGLSLRLDPGKIYGLLGRNGSGKTSLLSLIAALRRPTTGEILVRGERPFENPGIASRVCLIRESGDVQVNERISHALWFAGQVRTHFDPAYAAKLLDLFGLNPRQRIQTLSRGQKSALGCVLGLASRAPLTIFDESYLGMDAPARYAFYDALLADYLEHPRTIILSTHLIEEVARLFEEVVIIDRGRLVLHRDLDTLRERAAALSGPAGAVGRLADGLTVLHRQDFGSTRTAAVLGDLGELRSTAAASGVDIAPLGLQDLFVHLTGGLTAPIDREMVR